MNDLGRELDAATLAEVAGPQTMDPPAPGGETTSPGSPPQPETEAERLEQARARAVEEGHGALFDNGTVYVIQVAEDFEVDDTTPDDSVTRWWKDVATVTVAPRTRRDDVISTWLETDEGRLYAPARFGDTLPYRLLDVTAAEQLQVTADRKLSVGR